MKTYRVILETGPKDTPRPHELKAAKVIAEYFKTDIVFLRTSSMKTPDLKVGNIVWELKSPIGDGKNTIHNTFKTARKQSANIIIDLSRCKMHQTKAISNIKHIYSKRRNKNGKLLIITKTRHVLDISDKKS